MERETKIHAHKTTHRFLTSAIAEGAQVITPKRVPEAAWVRRTNMIGSFLVVMQL